MKPIRSKLKMSWELEMKGLSSPEIVKMMNNAQNNVDKEIEYSNENQWNTPKFKIKYDKDGNWFLSENYKIKTMKLTKSYLKRLITEVIIESSNIKKNISVGKINEKNIVDYIMEYDNGQMDDETEIDFFSYLKKSGLINQLQGMYGRQFEALVQDEKLDKNGEILEKEPA